MFTFQPSLNQIDLTNNNEDNQAKGPSPLKREMSLPEIASKRLKVWFSNTNLKIIKPLPTTSTLSPLTIPRGMNSLVVENSPDFNVIRH